MKRMSVKKKLSLWLTGLMVALFLVLLIFMVFISSTVAYQTAAQQLEVTLQEHTSQISLVDGTLKLDEDFSFHKNGVTVLVYSEKKTLLAGQIPVAFTGEVPFENGLSRPVTFDDQQYLLLDIWLPLSWEEGVWLRGMIEVPGHVIAENLLKTALIVLPLFIAAAAIGSYFIIRRSFRPLDTITSTAETIYEAKDLSGRIGIPPGKDEFSRLAHTFDEMFERLERSFEAEKQFTSDASHELRTPIAVIKGACEYSQKFDETPEERAESLEMIHRQTLRMSDIISQLLSMTRLDQGTEPVKKTILDLSALVRSIAEENKYPEKGMALDLEKNALVEGDGVLLSRLFRNLAENAFKYGAPEGPVFVSVKKDLHETVLIVRDEGPGIPPEEQDKVWQRFYQADRSRSEDGTGLGLAMVKQIAELHGGYMTLSSQPGEGSKFTLHLPPAEGKIQG